MLRGPLPVGRLRRSGVADDQEPDRFARTAPRLVHAGTVRGFRIGCRQRWIDGLSRELRTLTRSNLILSQER